MQRKLLPTAFLIAVLLFAPLSARAELVDCANCGRSLNPSVCTYCPYCGVRVTNYLQITDAYQKRNGQVYLSWQDGGGHAPYIIRYRRYVSSDILSSAQQKELLWLNSDSENTYQTSAMLQWLVPGYDYWIEVWDSRNTVCRYHYSAPEVYAFTDFSTSLQPQCRMQSGSGYSNQSAFSAAALAAASDIYGLYLRLEFPNFSQSGTYDLMVAIADPTGSPIVTSSLEDVQLQSGWTNYGWDFYKLDWYFSKVQKQHGAILTGKYTVYCYLNGQLAGSGNFTVQ